MDQQRDYNANGIFLIFCFCVILAVFYFIPILYKGPWAVWKLAELSVLWLVTTFIYKLEYHNLINSGLKHLIESDWAGLSREYMQIISSATALEYTGWFYIAIFAYLFYKRISIERFDTALDFDQLLVQLSRHFRFARCMIALDPTQDVKVLDFTKGHFRLKERIVPWLEKNNAVEVYSSGPTSNEIKYMNHEVADEALKKTLGRRFTAIENLHYYERWLFAVFCLYIKSNKIGDALCVEGDDILGDISYHINGECSLKQIERKVNSVIKRYENDTEVKAILNSHWYIYGVLKEMFHRAKSRGTHPSMHFTWLFTVDRTLALVLEETGMPDERGGVIEVSSPESGIECLYPRLHWTNETLMGVRLEKPACSYILKEIEKILISVYGYTSQADALEIKSRAKKTKP